MSSIGSNSDFDSSSIQTTVPEENLFFGLNPKQFVEELDRQVNLKQIIANANDPHFGKTIKRGGNHTTRNKDETLSKTSKQTPNVSRLTGSNTLDSITRDSILSHGSGMSTATDRMKKILKR